ncbi:MAG: hypothetical protein KDA21_13650 [Phycisphaerales bacterium]|nr:hypothetical protein [Phycisphaerales bacterium]
MPLDAVRRPRRPIHPESLSMNTLSKGIGATMNTLLNDVAEAARCSGCFGAVEVREDLVSCAAADAPEPAFYRLVSEDGRLWVEWVTADRWLSQSIEAELVFTGDDLEDMIDEELVDLGYEGPKLGALSHYRSEDLLYTFRSEVRVDAEGTQDEVVRALTTCLLAYEATFRELGDMAGGDDD